MSQRFSAAMKYATTQESHLSQGGLTNSPIFAHSTNVNGLPRSPVPSLARAPARTIVGQRFATLA
jgi:hypothetical protein